MKKGQLFAIKKVPFFWQMPKSWVFLLEFEFFAWVLSFFRLEFFPNVQRRWQSRKQNKNGVSVKTWISYGLTRRASCIISPAPAKGDRMSTPGSPILSVNMSKNVSVDDMPKITWFWTDLLPACHKLLCHEVHPVAKWCHQGHVGVTIVSSQLTLGEVK